MKILNSKLIRDISYVYPNYVSVPRYFPFLLLTHWGLGLKQLQRAMGAHSGCSSCFISFRRIQKNFTLSIYIYI